MMQSSRQLPFGLGLRYNYTNYLQRQRAINMLYLMLIVGVSTIILIPVNILSALLNQTALLPRDYLPAIALLFAFLITYLIQNGRLNWATRLLVGLNFVFLILVQGSSSVLTWSTMNALVLISAGLLLGRLSFFLVFAFVVLNLLRHGLVTSTSFAEMLASGYGTSFVLTVILFLSFWLFNKSLEDSVLRESDGNDQMIAVGKFLSRISRKHEDETYISVINFIRKELGYHFAQIFLVDDDTGLLTTRIRTVLGISLDANRSEVRVTDNNILTQALRTKTPIFMTNKGPDIRYDHFLPATVYGLAIPIMVRDNVVAVLDIQSSEGKFNRMRMRALELLADGLGVILEDVVTINALRLVLNDQSSTLENLRRQLNEYKQYEKQMVGGVWDEYLQGRGYEAIGFDLSLSDNHTPILSPAFDLPDDITPALESREVHVELSAEANRVYVPIILRGEVLGVLRFTLPPDRPPSERQLDLIQSVVDRLALALENKRLFEQSRSQAIRERKANEIARELIGATAVQDVLNLAARMFTDVLGAIHTHIQLQPDVMKSATMTHEVPSIAADSSAGGESNV